LISLNSSEINKLNK